MRPIALLSAAFLLVGGCARPPPGPPAPPLPRYDYWLGQLRSRPEPPGAAALMPRLRAGFAAEGVPPELAWMAEVESGLDPRAGGLFGARGPFQLSRSAARAEGLSTFLPDDRLNPERASRAVARRLRRFYREFGSWPLALAAYNAGEGRVARAVSWSRTPYFGVVVRDLPAATRRYVPEALALVAVRTGVAWDRLPPPR